MYKGLLSVSKKTYDDCYIPLYFDIETKTANTTKKGYLVTYLINKNSQKDIEKCIDRFLRL